MKWLFRIMITSFLLLSFAINGMLLISKTGFDILTGILDGWGVDNPVTSLKKSHTNISEQNKRMKQKVSQFAKSNNKKIAKRATRKVVQSATKSAAVFIPLAANVALTGSVMFDALELAEMCNDMHELETLIKEFQPAGDNSVTLETQDARLLVCAEQLLEIGRDSANSIIGDVSIFSEQMVSQFSAGYTNLSNEAKLSMSKSLDGWTTWKNDTLSMKPCELIGDSACDEFTTPLKILCAKTDNILWGCDEPKTNKVY